MEKDLIECLKKKEYLKETAKEYIEKYPERLNKFLTDYEADEDDFINKEIKYFNEAFWEIHFKGIYYDILNSEASYDGSSTEFFYREIGWEKFLYSTKQKLKFLKERKKSLKALPPQPIVKQKPEPNRKLITFKNSETIEKIHSELKGYFPNKEAELLKALQGEQLSEFLLFPHNQNKFVEVFRRLKYNGFLLNTDTEIKNWICKTFQFVKKGFVEPQPFNESSVWDNLNKGKGEPTKKERICITEWLPYKSPSQLTREAQNEKL
jgi:hypothetical protein